MGTHKITIEITDAELEALEGYCTTESQYDNVKVQRDRKRSLSVCQKIVDLAYDLES